MIGAAIWFRSGSCISRSHGRHRLVLAPEEESAFRATARERRRYEPARAAGEGFARASGDELAGIAARTAEERARRRCALADVPLKRFLAEPLVPYEEDEVTRLICDSHDAAAFAPVAHLTVGEFRDWLLSEHATTERLAALAPGLTPEMAAAVSKIMRLQDLVAAAAKCRVVTRFRSTIGLPAGSRRDCSPTIRPTI